MRKKRFKLIPRHREADARDIHLLMIDRISHGIDGDGDAFIRRVG